MRPLVLVVLLFLLWAPGASAWTWPVQGPVLLGFVFDPSHPYAGGQHRGVDIGAAPGTPVAAPASGTVTFAGTVPTSGKSVTIAPADVPPPDPAPEATTTTTTTTTSSDAPASVDATSTPTSGAGDISPPVADPPPPEASGDATPPVGATSAPSGAGDVSVPPDTSSDAPAPSI